MNLDERIRILKIYISENDQYEGHGLYHCIVKKMHEMDMAGITVTRGIEGYGKGKRIHNARVFEVSLELPIIIEIVDVESKLKSAIDVLDPMVKSGMMILADVEMVKYGGVLKSK